MDRHVLSTPCPCLELLAILAVSHTRVVVVSAFAP